MRAVVLMFVLIALGCGLNGLGHSGPAAVLSASAVVIGLVGLYREGRGGR